MYEFPVKHVSACGIRLITPEDDFLQNSYGGMGFGIQGNSDAYVDNIIGGHAMFYMFYGNGGRESRTINTKLAQSDRGRIPGRPDDPPGA